MATIGRRFLVQCVLVLLIVGVVMPEFRQPAQAYEGEHFAWTYYLALHVGYTKRQAYQIASAAYAVDWDPNTGPMEAGPAEVLLGAQHPGMWYLSRAGRTSRIATPSGACSISWPPPIQLRIARRSTTTDNGGRFITRVVSRCIRRAVHQR